MTIKTIAAPHLGPGRTVKLGRKRPIAHGPRLQLANYLRATLPVAPDSVDYSPLGRPALQNIYGNDTLGDCVIAGAYHIVATESGNAGDLFTATRAQIIADYSAIGGYIPDDSSTDNGCDEPTALNYWRENGFANGTRPLGWVTVDATNRSALSTALYLFENLYFGVELPDQWLSNFPPDGFRWDVAGPPKPENGHCVIGVGYDNIGVKIDTWGVLGTVTWAALAKYFIPAANGATYVLLTPDQLKKGQSRAPNGIAWSSLIADFDAIGGTVPVTPQNFNLQTTLGVQQALNYLGAAPQLVEDGIVGPKTAAAIKSFQRVHDLAVDGIVGRKTRAALRAAIDARQ